MSAVPHVGKERARGAVQNVNARLLRYVLKRAVTSIAIETIRQPRRLADIYVVKTVAVHVAHGNPVISVNVDAAGAVQYGAPIVRAVNELLPVGRNCTER